MAFGTGRPIVTFTHTATAIQPLKYVRPLIWQKIYQFIPHIFYNVQNFTHVYIAFFQQAAEISEGSDELEPWALWDHASNDTNKAKNIILRSLQNYSSLVQKHVVTGQ